MQPMTISIPTKIIFGVDSHSRIPDEVRALGGDTVFLVTDKGVAQTDFFKKVTDLLHSSKIGFETFDDVEADPSDQTVEKAFNLFQKGKATVLLAVGGGSPMDTAKAVGILATNGGRLHDYEAVDRLKIPPLPLLAPGAAHAGMDACVHALESYVSLQSSPLTQGITLHAIRLIAESLRPFVANRGNLEAGANMLSGAAMGAIGFTNTGAGNVHCLGRC